MTLPARNLTGQRFGTWHVLASGPSGPTRTRPNGQRNGAARYWLCQCACGALRNIRQDALCRPNVPNCGCTAWKGIARSVPQPVIGTSAYLVDPKGRLVIPPPLRLAVIGLVAAPRSSVLLFPASRLGALLRRWPAEFTQTAHLVPVNRDGRVQVPQHLRAWANLWPGTEVAVSGLGETALVQRAEAFDARLGVVMEGLYQTWTRSVRSL